MNPRRTSREKVNLTQPAAAGKAGVSLATWRRWEEDPDTVSAMTRTKCERVLDSEQAWRTALSDSARTFEQAWQDCPFLTPRQASALSTSLAVWADSDLGGWLGGSISAPLHDVRPFDLMDRRVLILINENKAFVQITRERCLAISEEIEQGVLPFDRPGCFMDELLVAAALEDAELQLNDMFELYADIPVRTANRGEADLHWVGDDDWGLVRNAFLKKSRSDEWEWLIERNSSLAGPILRKRHPYTWFDF